MTKKDDGKRTRQREATRRYRAAHPELFGFGGASRKVTRAWQLKRQYGLTLAEYDAMVEAQNGLCAICGKPETSNRKNSPAVDRLSIDHDHQTGKVRALLCNRCNRAIGLFDDDLELARKAVEYLEGFK